jgi:transposase
MNTQLYPTDLTDSQWVIIQELIPPAKPGGRPRSLDMRQVVLRPHERQGFTLLPRRWVVERTFAWFSHHRRLSKDYEGAVARYRRGEAFHAELVRAAIDRVPGKVGDHTPRGNASPPFPKTRFAAGEGEAVLDAMWIGQGVLRMRRLGPRRAVNGLPCPYHRLGRGDVGDANDADDVCGEARPDAFSCRCAVCRVRCEVNPWNWTLLDGIVSHLGAPQEREDVWIAKARRFTKDANGSRRAAPLRASCSSRSFVSSCSKRSPLAGCEAIPLACGYFITTGCHRVGAKAAAGRPLRVRDRRGVRGRGDRLRIPWTVGMFAAGRDALYHRIPEDERIRTRTPQSEKKLPAFLPVFHRTARQIAGWRSPERGQG